MSSTAIVTGSTGGWGGAVVEAFLAAGWTVVAPHRGGGRLPPAGDRVVPVEADVADPAAAARVVAAAREAGGPDALANVAGGFQVGGPLHEASEDVWRGQLAVNLETAYAMTRAALPALLERGRGSVVFVSSLTALRPFRGAAAYAVSKAAVLALMQALAVELRGTGVRANALLPGMVDTPRNRAENPDADTSRWASPEEVARLVVWLCSPESEPLSGASLPVEG